MRFFLSRSAGDDDSYSLRFFRDLSMRVVERLDSPGGDAGFVDVDQKVGATVSSGWSAEAWDALNTCQVFVALCSPRYFLNDRCGREWWTFAERVRRHEQVTGHRHGPALIPVLWSGAPLADGDTPVSGREHAVRQLLRVRSLRSRYEAFLDSLAEQVTASLVAGDLPSLDRDPATVPNAFDVLGADTMAQLLGARDPGDATARSVHFIVAAGSRSEMEPIREDVQFYGERGRDWAPFKPSLPSAIAERARQVAAGRLLSSEVAELSELAGRIERAHRNNEIVVLLVDSWITKLAEYRRRLSIVDGRDEPAVAVLAPANRTDPETARHRGELSSELCGAFPNFLARGDQLVRLEIDDMESFEAELVTVLEEALNRVFRNGRVFRRPAAEAPVSRPILQGP